MWGIDMGAKLQKYDKWIAALLSAGVLAITLIALHDMQYSQGIGLYLSMQAESQNRIMFDVLTDIVVCISLIMLIWLPCMFLKHRNAKAFFRLLVAFLAFMPKLSMAYLVHLVDTPGVFALRMSLLEGRVSDAFFEGCGAVYARI